MKPTEYEAFRALISDVYAFYRHDVSDFALSVWWSAMRQYDLRAVNEAVGRHAVNPDSGQFMPKPADIVKMLGGTTKDSALVAWSKVDKAIRNVGPWEDVAFDDPLIHRVLYDMGGWMMLGQNTSDEIKFIAKEFEARYRGFKMRSENPEYPPVLIGLAGASNRKNGKSVAPPVLIGDKDAAVRVIQCGEEKPLLQIHRAGSLAEKEALLLIAP